MRASGVRPISVLALLVGCAAPSKTTPLVLPPDAAPAESAVPKSAPREAAPPPLDDPRAVRCGVDDAPVEVREEAPAPPEPDELEDTDRIEKSRLNNTAGTARGRVDPASIVRVAPPPSNAALDRGITVLAITSLSRDDGILEPRGASLGTTLDADHPGREDVTSCGLTMAQHQTALTLEVRLAATGVPSASLAEGVALNDAQRRCLSLLGCRLALPASERPTTVRLRGQLGHTPPSFSGYVGVRTRPAASGAVSPSALKKLDDLLRPLARTCVDALPPRAAFSATLTTKVDESGHLVRTSPLPSDAAGALFACVSDKLATLPPLPRTVLPGTLLLTKISPTIEIRFR